MPALAAILARQRPRLVHGEPGGRLLVWECFGRQIRWRPHRPQVVELEGPPLLLEELERLLAQALPRHAPPTRPTPPIPARPEQKGPEQTPRSPRNVRVMDCDGRPLRPTTRARAANDVAAGRAEWVGPDAIRLRYSPLADALVREQVRRRDGGRCRWCGAHTRGTALLVPRARGGRVTLANCVACCERCARAKGDLLPEEFARRTGFPVPRP